MVEPDNALMDRLADYLAARDHDRAAQVEAILAKMTTRERALVCEVAVMSYVRGKLFGGPRDENPPPTSVIVANTISACVAMDDLYPTLRRLARATARTRAVSRG